MTAPIRKSVDAEKISLAIKRLTLWANTKYDDREHVPRELLSVAADVISALSADLQDARAALATARDTFRRYEALHAAKPDPVKAAINRDLANEMEAALPQSRSEGT